MSDCLDIEIALDGLVGPTRLKNFKKYIIESYKDDEDFMLYVDRKVAEALRDVTVCLGQKDGEFGVRVCPPAWIEGDDVFCSFDSMTREVDEMIDEGGEELSGVEAEALRKMLSRFSG